MSLFIILNGRHSQSMLNVGRIDQLGSIVYEFRILKKVFNPNFPHSHIIKRVNSLRRTPGQMRAAAKTECNT